jgi:hypothetical protein
MPFLIRPSRRFPVHCAVTYNAGPFQGQGIVWNLSCTGWRLSGDLPMRPGETLSLTVTPISFGVVASWLEADQLGILPSRQRLAEVR